MYRVDQALSQNQLDHLQKSRPEKVRVMPLCLTKLIQTEYSHLQCMSKSNTNS